MAIKFSRRLFVSIVSSIATLITFGASAQQDAKGGQVGIGTPIDGVVPFVGPVIAESRSALSSEGSDVMTNQKTGLHPYQTIDDTGYHPNAKE
jgi:hypothetical protein